MRGMELSRAYFEAYGRNMIGSQFAEYESQVAAGLVGEGSECLGYDDRLSQDHDFGPGFCIWLPESVFREIGPQMQQAYDNLPKTFEGFRRNETSYGGGRVGVFSLEEFYRKYTGLTHAPKDNMEWFRIPQDFLATATNGEVFIDNLGEFTKIRTELKNYYPEDVLKKKLAAKVTVMAQAGQYNYPRCQKRGDTYAAYMACGEFIRAALAVIYLLNEEYKPFYKWSFHGLKGMHRLKRAIHELKELALLADSGETGRRKEWLIEDICVEVGRELNRRGYTLTSDSFLQTHGEELMRGITDTRLRNLHIMIDGD